MKVTALLKNQRGSTLIEALVAIAVLTIGVLAVMGMQVRAIGASSTALNRTGANNVALSLLETLKELEFDNPNLVQTHAVLPASPINLAVPDPITTDPLSRTFTAASLPEMQSLIRQPLGAAPAGTIVDRSDITYRLFWAVQDRILATGETLNKTIRVYMIWNSPLGGQNRLDMTTVKYNNISLAL